MEYGEIVTKLENSYIKAFDASPISWCCFMDHAYREQEPAPHVHWHVYPRYKNTIEVGGIIFGDPLYGDIFDHRKEKLVDSETLTKISERIKVYL